MKPISMKLSRSVFYSALALSLALLFGCMPFQGTGSALTGWIVTIAIAATSLFASSCGKKDESQGLLLGVIGYLTNKTGPAPTNWVQDAYLKASNADAQDFFGAHVSISGDTIVVGAVRESSNVTTVDNTDGSASADNSVSRSGAVYVFQKDGNGDWFQDAYVKASNAEASEYFGETVSVSGNTIAVGVRREDSNATGVDNTDGSASADNSVANSGAVYVYQKDTNGNWFQDAYLKASNAETKDYFGETVSISGDTIVVGARREWSNITTVDNTDGSASADNSTKYSGAAYVFKKDTNGDWIQDAYLKASNADTFDYFGKSVSISGNTIAVGATWEGSNSTSIDNTDGSASADVSALKRGAVYVFKKDSNGDWSQDAYLKASNASDKDYFGETVSVSGSTIAAGVRYEDSNATGITNTDGSASADNSVANSGAVYVFQKDTNGDWIQDAYLKASNAESNDYFARTVSISGDIIAVGAALEDSNATGVDNTDGKASADNSVTDSGAVYIFRKDSSGNWFQDAYIKASNAYGGDWFGISVSVDGSTVVAGALFESGSDTAVNNKDGSASSYAYQTQSGAAYVFTIK